MDVSDFDFALPHELIAQDPPPVRGASRLLVLRRDTGRIAHTLFARLDEYLHAGDLLVVNNTKVFPARLLGRRVPSGGGVECLLLRQEPGSGIRDPGSAPDAGADLQVRPHVWEALVHPGQKLRPGAKMVFEGSGIVLHGEILSRHFHGRRTVRLQTDGGIDVVDAIERIGHVPLPPYIKRDDTPADRERYQTVYARERGSVAAPTAGLHVTPALLDALASRAVERAEVTLHVGYGTFKPIRTTRVEEHVVDPEHFSVTAAAAAALTRARRASRRVIAVGTTTCRVLESLEVDADSRVHEAAGEATLFIRPGHTFRLTDGLITNFHLPQSSLLVLVAAFAGRERILEAYREAVAEGYRFYSYGDAMLIL